MYIESAINFFGTQQKMANEIGVKQQTVSDWLNNKLKPSIKNAVAIEQATNGKVTRQELRPDVFGDL